MILGNLKELKYKTVIKMEKNRTILFSTKECIGLEFVRLGPALHGVTDSFSPFHAELLCFYAFCEFVT